MAPWLLQTYQVVSRPISWLRARLSLGFYLQHDPSLFLGEHKFDGTVQPFLPKHQRPTGVKYHKGEFNFKLSKFLHMFESTASHIDVLDGRVCFFLEFSEAAEWPGRYARSSINRYCLSLCLILSRRTCRKREPSMFCTGRMRVHALTDQLVMHVHALITIHR